MFQHPLVRQLTERTLIFQNVSPETNFVLRGYLPEACHSLEVMSLNPTFVANYWVNRRQRFFLSLLALKIDSYSLAFCLWCYLFEHIIKFGLQIILFFKLRPADLSFSKCVPRNKLFFVGLESIKHYWGRQICSYIIAYKSKSLVGQLTERRNSRYLSMKNNWEKTEHTSVSNHQVE